METTEKIKLFLPRGETTNWAWEFLRIEQIRKKYSMTNDGWSEPLGGHGIKVAVIDHGVISCPQFNHKAIEEVDVTSKKAKNLWNSIRYRSEDSKLNVLSDIHLRDERSSDNSVTHGSEMAAYIGGLDGIAPACDLMVINIFDVVFKELVLPLAIYYAISRGVHIINIGHTVSVPTPELDAALNCAFENNVAVFCSAGNAYRPEILAVGYPAAHQLTYSIGGFTPELTLFPDGERGRLLDFMAPATNIPSLIDGTFLNPGTAVSTAIASGIIALFLQKFRNVYSRMPSSGELKEILLDKAVHPYDEIHDTFWGYGILHPAYLFQFFD